MKATLGLVRRPALMDLESLHWPRSFPAGTMHCVLINIVPNLHKLWGGKRSTKDAQKQATAPEASERPDDEESENEEASPFAATNAPATSGDYVIRDDNIWQFIGETQVKSRSMIPRIMAKHLARSIAIQEATRRRNGKLSW